MKTFLIKRNLDFTIHGVLVKRNVLNKHQMRTQNSSTLILITQK